MSNDSHPDPSQQGGVPTELRKINQWCRWRLELNRQGRKTKIPYHLDLSRQFATSRDEPYSFFDAVTAGPNGEQEGIGFVLRTEGEGVEHPDEGLDCTLLAIDADGCRDPVTGELTEWGRELFELAGRTYTEVSPSGCGIRLFLWIDTPPTDLARSKVKVPHPAAPNVPEHKAVEIQLFTKTGYVTVTGDRLIEASALIERKPSIDWLTAAYPQFREQDKTTAKLPVGRGECPTVQQVADEINRAPRKVREAVVDANWHELVGDTGSASEGYWRVAQHVLRAAQGHGAPAVSFLLNETDWGLGLCEDSAEPLKYARSEWVRKEVARIGGKAETVNASEAFADDFKADEWRPPASALPPVLTSPIDECWPDAAPTNFLDERPPERRYLLRHPEDDAGALPLGEVGILSAEGGAGKTTAIVQLAIAVATGGQWFGHYNTDDTIGRRVALFLGEENALEVHRKLYWTCANMGLEPDERAAVLANVVAVPLASQVVPLLQLGLNGNIESTVHASRIRARLDASPEPWGLTVVDPISRFCGVNVEGDNILATRFVQELESFCRAPGTPTTLALAHSSKVARRLGEADSRGVTGLTDGARWWGTLVARSKSSIRFDVRKSNYTRPAVELDLMRGERGILSVETAAERAQRAAFEQESGQEKEARKEQERHDHIGKLLARVVETLTRQPGLSKRQACAQTIGKTTDLNEAIDRGLANGTLLGTREGSRVVLTVSDILR